jgi:hypothetical protein
MGLRKSAVEIERVVDLSAADEIADGAAARHAAGPETQESKSRMSTATDAELVALGERFEKLLLEYVGSWLNWTPQMRAAHAEVGDNTAALAAALQHAGGEGAQARMSELERDMQPLASHEGAFEFSDDGSRSLFGAVAVMTGLMPLVRELEARLAADLK